MQFVVTDFKSGSAMGVSGLVPKRFRDIPKIERGVVYVGSKLGFKQSK